VDKATFGLTKTPRSNKDVAKWTAKVKGFVINEKPVVKRMKARSYTPVCPHSHIRAMSIFADMRLTTLSKLKYSFNFDVLLKRLTQTVGEGNHYN